MMATVLERTPAMDAVGAEIASEIFDLLVREQRGDPIATAVDHAYEAIWRSLIRGDRAPGERLSDGEGRSALGVSRTPVRQALHRLAQDELVRFDPRRGFSVRTFDVADIHEMYDVRATLEAMAVRLAAPRLPPSELQRHLDLLRELRARVDERPVVACLRHDFQMHNLIIRASGNGRLVRILAALRSQISLFQIRDAGYPDRLLMALNDHESVLVALLEGQTEEAAQAMADHIRIAKEAVLVDMFAGQRSPRTALAGAGANGRTERHWV